MTIITIKAFKKSILYNVGNSGNSSNKIGKKWKDLSRMAKARLKHTFTPQQKEKVLRNEVNAFWYMKRPHW
jgi:hypothetical protein